MPIKILTLNTAMMIEVHPFKVEPGKLKRAEKLSKALLKENYDIIFMQEVFQEAARDIIFSNLKNDYPYVIKKAGTDFMSEDSGLALASKLPVLKKHYIEFTDYVGTDSFARKGCLFASFDLKAAGYPGVQLYTFNTHLQADKDNDDIRRKQLREIRELMINIHNKIPASLGNSNVSSIFLGDLNIEGDTNSKKKTFSEYYKLIELMNYPRDLYISTKPQGAGYTWDGLNNSFIPKDDKDQQRLDFIFALDKVPVLSSDWKSQFLRKISCISCKPKILVDNKNINLSDHYGIEAVLKF